MDDALEVAQLSGKSASCNNCKTYPKTPNDATQNGDDFMTEKLRDSIVSGGRLKLLFGGMTNRRK